MSVTMYILQGGSGGAPTLDSPFIVPCPSDRSDLQNPPRKHLPNHWWQLNIGEYNRGLK